MTIFEGHVTTLAEHYVARREPRSVAAQAVRLWPVTEPVSETLVSCVIDDVLLTSDFVSIDIARGHLFIDQSYSNLLALKPVRFAVTGDRFRLESTPIRSHGRHVVIGGPLDGVWYHWLFSWCPRMLLVKRLRPDLFAAEDVRFVVHPRAMVEPFRSILDSFGLPAHRFLAVDPARDYRLEQVALVSFLDQNKLFPEITRTFSRHLVDWFGLDREADGGTAGVFASRQALPAPKRRIANFDEVRPVLDAFGIAVACCGSLPAREQAALFHRACTVVGAHGSDLANLLFCRPGTEVVVIENTFSVGHNLHVGLLTLAEIMGLRYRLFLAGTAEDGDGLTTAQRIGRDYLVDPERLRLALLAATAP